jgi:hypothetical protein
MYNQSKRQGGYAEIGMGIFVLGVIGFTISTYLIDSDQNSRINSLEHNVCQLSVMQEQYTDPNDTTERSKALLECME